MQRKTCGQSTRKNTRLRTQKMESSKVALNAVETSDEPILRWFATKVLKLSAEWTPMVALALFEKQSTGKYGWQTAQNPYAYLVTVARNLAIKVQPELVLGDSQAVPSGRIAEAVAAGKSIFGHQGTEGV